MVVEFLFSAVDLEDRSDDCSKGPAVAFDGFGLKICLGFYLLDEFPNSDVALLLNQLGAVVLNRSVPALSLKRQKDVSCLCGSSFPIRGSKAPFVAAPAVLDVNRPVWSFVAVPTTSVGGFKNAVFPVAKIGL